MKFKECYDVICQFDEDGRGLEQNALDLLYNLDFSEIETSDEEIKYYRYERSYNGVDMYYDYGADYYFYVKSENN